MKAKQSPARTPRKAKSKAKANGVPSTVVGSPRTVLGHGITASWESDTLLLAIDCGADAYAKAPMSSTGKMRLLANSRGWQHMAHAHGFTALLQLNVGRKQ